MTLAGVWICQGNGPNGQVQERNVLQADGQFSGQSLIVATGRTIRIWGRWSMAGQNILLKMSRVPIRNCSTVADVHPVPDAAAQHAADTVKKPVSERVEPFRRFLYLSHRPSVSGGRTGA